MRRTMLLVGAVVVAVLLASAASGSAGSVQARWVIRDLGTLGGKQSDASAVNALGQVVVSSVGAKGGTRYFLWQNGKARDLGMPSLFIPPVLNDLGEALGRRPVESGFRYFLWRDGRVRDLGVVNGGQAISFDNQGVVVAAGSDEGGGVYRWRAGRWKALPRVNEVGGARSTANDVNSRAQAVGDWNPTGLTDHAALWENGRWKDLRASPVGGDSSARCINEQGVITGVATINRRSVWHGFVWEKGKLRDIGTLGGPESSGGCMNTRGQIVGAADTKIKNKQGDFVAHAILWQNGHMTDLGTLTGGTTASRAWDINERDQIIGSGDTTLLRQGGTDGAGHSLKGVPFTHAFVWQNGTMTDLGTLPGGKESWAAAINNNDQIIGYSTTKNGQRHAVLWTLRTG